MEPLILLAVTFILLWMLFIRPQQRRVRAHEQLISTLEVGDEVVLGAGIFGRITELGPDDMVLEVAPGVEVKVARQAVLRQVETLPQGGGPEQIDGDAVNQVPDEADRTTLADEPGVVDLGDDDRPPSDER